MKDFTEAEERFLEKMLEKIHAKHRMREKRRELQFVVKVRGAYEPDIAEELFQVALRYDGKASVHWTNAEGVNCMKDDIPF